MRSIDSSVLDQLKSNELKRFELLTLDVGAGFNYTDCDVPITNFAPSDSGAGAAFEDGDIDFIDEDVEFAGGILFGTSQEIWKPCGFSYQPVSYSMDNVVDQLILTVDNLDQELTPDFVGGTAQRSDVILRSVVLNAADEPLGAVTIFQGVIDSWNMPNDWIEITVASELVQWNQRTLAIHSPSCRWDDFKGTECAYTGTGTWCDRTYARCGSLGNAENFGGCRWLPSIEDKEIWWGKERAV